MNFNIKRARILTELKKGSLSVTQISRNLGKGYSRKAVGSYLKELKKSGLVLEGYLTKKRGERVPKCYSLSKKAIPISKKLFDLIDLLKGKQKELDKDNIHLEL